MDWKSTLALSLCCSFILFSWLTLVEAHPADNKDIRSSNDPLAFSSNELPNETPKTDDKNQLTRNKRTVGFLRQLFPGLSQILDRKIQQITRILFRVVGRLILRGGGDGNGGGSSDNDAGNRKISITLPTYAPSSEDDEEDTQSPTEKDVASTDSPSTDAKSSNSSSTDSSSTSGSSGDSGTASVSEAPENNMIVRKSRDVSDVLSDTTFSPLDDENSSSTTESTTKRGGLLSLITRSRRGSLLGNGSSGGSGNFVFDLIKLIAGSGTTPEKDEELNAPREERDDDAVDNAEANDVNGGNTNSPYNPDEDTGGIPGPLTRFALLVNRGIGNIVKDIILLCPRSDEKCTQYKTAVLKNVVNKIR